MVIERPYVNTDFLEVFRRRHGRALRVLHIGNVANNAYQNAKLLNALGADCDVICWNYYHIMACPEWEEADFSGPALDEDRPDWTTVNLNGFARPEWFAQGPELFCLKYLLARRTKDRSACKYWLFLGVSNKTAKPSVLGTFGRLERRLRILLDFVSWRSAMLLEPRKVLVERVKGVLLRKGVDTSRTPGRQLHVLLALSIVAASVGPRLLAAAWRFARALSGVPQSEIAERIARLEARFRQLFPHRSDCFRRSDLQLLSVDHKMDKWAALLEHYDLVHGYATDGIFPLLAGKPYVAFEHGTLREIPFEATSRGRCCALSYRLANHVLITNADNRIAAQRLDIQRCAFVPHMVNESHLPTKSEREALRRKLHADLGSAFVVFCPARHHWRADHRLEGDKGNDIFLAGFARFVKEDQPNAKAILVKWGTSLEQSFSLIDRLDISANVIWISPRPHPEMMRLICGSDLVADQFVLGAFGNIMPKALLCGLPAVMFLEQANHAWCFEVMPPLINAKTPEDIHAGMRRLYTDPKFAKELAERGAAWYAKYHSNTQIAEGLLATYRDVLAAKELWPSRDAAPPLVCA